MKTSIIGMNLKKSWNGLKRMSIPHYIFVGSTSRTLLSLWSSKHILPEKVFGIFPEQLVDEYDFLTNGFDEIHYTPHSRHTAIDEEAVKKVKCLSILSKNDEIGSNIIVTKDYRQIFILGHLEYGKETLKDEYFRDLKANKPIHIPFNYFPDDDPEKEPILKWRSHANLLYRNWLNYVYQLTPFEIEEIGKIKEPIGTGSREDHGYAKTFTKYFLLRIFYYSANIGVDK